MRSKHQQIYYHFIFRIYYLILQHFVFILFDLSFLYHFRRMSITFRRSHRTKNQVSTQNISRVDVLHNGIKRKVSQVQYTKIFAKLKIQTKSRNQSFIPLNSIEPENNIESQNQRLRLMVRNLQAQNHQLKSKNIKQEKLDKMIMKKIEDEDINYLSFQKAIQIKLLLEAQALNQQLQEKSKSLNQLIKQQKAKSAKLYHYDNSSSILFHAILHEQTNHNQSNINQKNITLKKHKSQIAQIRSKIQQIKQEKQNKTNQLLLLNSAIQAALKHLPINHKIKDENDSGMYGSQIRTMTTTSLQTEIHDIRLQNIDLENKIQKLVEDKIKSKLQILKITNQIQTKMIRMRHSDAEKVKW